MRLLYIPIVSFLIVTVLVPPLMRHACWLGLTDKPSDRKVHFTEIPRIGGIAMVIGVIVPAVLLLPPQPDLLALEFGIGILFLFGLLDDRLNLSYKIKFFGQILAAVIVVVFGQVTIRYMPFFDFYILPDMISYPLTILIIVGVTNAINLSDGLDGLAGGLGALILCLLCLLAYENGDQITLIFSLSVLAAVLGFLRYNTNPALVFMGDTGSQFLGFSTSALAILLTQRPDSAVSMLTPAVLFILPVLDTLFVMVRRIQAGKSPFSADRTHFHHRLLSLGLSHHEAVLAVYFIQSLLILVAYLSRYASDSFVMFLIAAICFLFVLSSLFQALSQRLLLEFPVSAGRVLPDYFSVPLSFSGKLISILMLLEICLILLPGALILPEVPFDIALFSLFLFLSLLACMKAVNRCFLLGRVSLHFALLVILFLLSELYPGSLYLDFSLALCVWFSITIILFFKFTSLPFRATSLDYLLLVIVIFLQIFSGKGSSVNSYLFFQIFIVFYIVEIIYSSFQSLRIILSWVTHISLVILTAKAFLAR